MATRFNDLPEPGIDALERVGGVDHPPHLRREGKERRDQRPRAAPRGDDGGKLLPQWARGQVVEAPQGDLRGRGRVEWPERRRKRLARSEEHTSELQSLAYLVCRL